jgi:hypothetical protein
MKTHRPLILLLTQILSAVPALALTQQLDQPGVAHPADYPEAAQKQVREALTRPDCKFLKGYFLNSHTSLLYAGDTKALNLFLDALAKCPGVNVRVSFAHAPASDEVCDWMLAHDATMNAFHIRVNLDSKHIQLTELYIPSANGPPFQ